jgi:hypothetical protein
MALFKNQPLPHNVWLVTLASFFADILSEMLLNLLLNTTPVAPEPRRPL